MTDAMDSQRRKKGRSPSYPAVNLETAIERARQVWEKEKQHPAPVHTIMRHWGYQSATGPGSLILAALRKFGLLDYEGAGEDRRAKLTDLAIEILKSPHADERARAIQRAALNPAIHRELFDKYGASLPSDDSLAWELQRERHFTESGTVEFIPELRDTIAFAGLGSSARVDVGTSQDRAEDAADEDELPQEPERKRVRRVTGAGDVLTYAVPVAPGLDVAIEGPFPLSEGQWNQFMAVLQVLKPGLVMTGPTRVDEAEDE